MDFVGAFLGTRSALSVVKCLCSCPVAWSWLSRPQFGSVSVLLSCIKGTLTTGCHFAFLCSRAHMAVYCYAPGFISLNACPRLILIIVFSTVCKHEAVMSSVLLNVRMSL